MRNDGPILIIDDDTEDLDFLSETLKSLNLDNEILLFDDGRNALEYLKGSTVQPFLIFCDINMHRMTGFQLREIMLQHENLRLRSIPFLFLTTSTAFIDVNEAYELIVQGYFVKPNSFPEIQEMLHAIVNYWNFSSSKNGKK